MTTKSLQRGNHIEFLENNNNIWIYSDTKEPVPENYKTRPCGNCGRNYTEEGHSKKPDIIRDNIVKIIGDVPRIELFAREKVEGWDSYGNEIESDIELIK